MILSSLAGEFEERSPAGKVLHSGPCALSLDAETLAITASSGPALALDLGEIDSVTAGDHQLSLATLDGSRLRLYRFGRPHDDLVRSFLGAWRDRLVKCLLLADLAELDRFEAWASFDGGPVEPSPAEVRLYESNVAVLPLAGAAFHWRLADIESVEFDRDRYALKLVSPGRCLCLTKAGRRSEELRQRIEDSRRDLQARSLLALDRTFPFLGAARLSALAALMKEGHLVPLAALGEIDDRLLTAAFERPVDPDLHPYVAELGRRAAGRGVHVGFSLIRPDRDSQPESEEEPPGDTLLPLFWFVFVLECRLPGLDSALAWESTSHEGRATYLFGVPGQPAAAESRRDFQAEAVRAMERGLSRLNRRRGPIYLPDAELERDPSARHYRVAARRVPEVRALRSAFLGRAVHSSFDGWQGQLDARLAADARMHAVARREEMRQ